MTTRIFQAISRFYSELADEDMFPLPAVLRIMQLRPLTQGMFDAISEAAGMKGDADAEKAFHRGDLNDVPDLITLLHNVSLLWSLLRRADIHFVHITCSFCFTCRYLFI